MQPRLTEPIDRLGMLVGVILVVVLWAGVLAAAF